MMNDFIYNPEFWVAILFAIGFSLVLAVICQFVYDTYMELRVIEDSEDSDVISYVISEDSIGYGDTVYDSVDKCTGIVVGTCLGEDNDEYFVVIRAIGTSIYIYKSVPSALTKITEQE